MLRATFPSALVIRLVYVPVELAWLASGVDAVACYFDLQVKLQQPVVDFLTCYFDLGGQAVASRHIYGRVQHEHLLAPVCGASGVWCCWQLHWVVCGVLF